VSECGGAGISANIRSIVTKNRVQRTGRAGISMSPEGLYSHNTVADAALGGGGEPAISGGKASGGKCVEDFAD
jgi:hypothetical protein